jgi:hypothetical protein
MNPALTWETKVEGPQVKGQPGLRSKTQSPKINKEMTPGPCVY